LENENIILQIFIVTFLSHCLKSSRSGIDFNHLCFLIDDSWLQKINLYSNPWKKNWCLFINIPFLIRIQNSLNELSKFWISFYFNFAFQILADWLLFYVYYKKSVSETILPDIEKQEATFNANGTTQGAWNDQVKTFFEVRFANLMDYCIPAFCVSYLFFFAIGGYLHVTLF